LHPSYRFFCNNLRLGHLAQHYMHDVRWFVFDKKYTHKYTNMVLKEFLAKMTYTSNLT